MTETAIDSTKWTRNALMELSLSELRRLLVMLEGKKENKTISLIKRVIHYKQLPDQNAQRPNVPRRTLGKQERIL